MEKLSKTETTLTNGLEKKQRALQVYSPQNCFKHSHKIKTVRDVLGLPSKTLGEFKRLYGRQWVIDYLSFWLVDLNNNAQVKNKMGEAQIDFTAERIYDTYPMKVTDLTLFFRNVKEGSYGSYYETLSQEKVMQWMGQYWDARCAMGEMMNQGRHENFSLTKDGINPEVAKKMFEGVGEKKIEYPEGEGMGTRTKKALSGKVGENILEKHKTAHKMSREELKKYLVHADYNDENFDPVFYRIAEAEFDRKSKNK